MNGTIESTSNKISTWLESKLEELDCFLVDIRHNPSGDKIQVFVDSDTRISIDKCAEISRYLEFHLDHEESVSDKYNLEVSSPGMDKPFKVRRQYLNQIGKEIDLLLLNGERKSGVLKELTDDLMVIEAIVSTKGKKKNGPPETERIEIRFDAVKEAKKKISFK